MTLKTLKTSPETVIVKVCSSTQKEDILQDMCVANIQQITAHKVNTHVMMRVEGHIFHIFKGLKNFYTISDMTDSRWVQ